MGERVADDLGLLVDLLGHEVPVIAPFREQASGRAQLDRAPDPISGAIANVGPLAGQHDPIAFLEIGDTVGERRERERVGTQIHLAVAVADRERRALPRADQQVVLTLEQIDERESAAQALERRMNRLLRRLALSEFVLDQERGDLGVGLGRERMALGGELVTQRSEVFDDAVVDHGESRRRVGMGVGLGRLAVRRPAGVADADRARERIAHELGLEILEFALGAPPLQTAVLQGRNAGRVVAAIFESLQRLDDRPGDRPPPQHAHYAAHRRYVPAAPRIEPRQS